MIKRFLIGFAVIAFCLPAFADETPLNHYSTKVITATGSYVEVGNGLNYETAPGVFERANPVITSGAPGFYDYKCTTTHNRVMFKDDISQNWPIVSQVGRTSTPIKSKPVGIAYLNIQTKEYTPIQVVQSTIGVVTGNKIMFENAMPDIDVEYVIDKGDFKQNVYIKSKASFQASPYPLADTAVAFITEFDLVNRGDYQIKTMSNSLPINVEGDFDDVDGGAHEDGETGEFKFTRPGSKLDDALFVMADATDAAGDVKAIRKRLIRKNGQYFLLEALPASWLKDAAYPVLLDYQTKSGSITTNTTWDFATDDTYYVSSSVTLDSGADLIIEAGIAVKFASATTLKANSTNSKIDTRGTDGSEVYFTSCKDQTVGDDTSGESGCSGAAAKGDWTGLTTLNGTTELNLDFTVVQWATEGIDIVGTYPNWYFDNVMIRWSSGQGLDTHRGNSGLMTMNYVQIYENDSHGWNATGANSHDVRCYNCVIHDNGGYGIYFGVGGTTRCFNCLVYDNTSVGIGTDATQGNGPDMRLVTSDSNGNFGLYWGTAWSSSYTRNNIMTNNVNYGIRYLNSSNASCTVYNTDLYGNSVSQAIYTGCETTANNITTDPEFETGTLKGGLWSSYSAAYFLTQATSGAVDTGYSDSDAAIIDMSVLYTTSTDGTADSGTVDMGFHYPIAHVSVADEGPNYYGRILNI